MATISRLRVEGFRCIEKLELDLGGLTVLIGVNGSGKSTIIEALEVLHLIGARIGDFFECFGRWHGGYYGTFRRAPEWVDHMTLGVSVKDGATEIAYEVTFVEQNQYAVIDSETLSANGKRIVHRKAIDINEPFRGKVGTGPNMLAVPQLASTVPEAGTLLSALGGIDVHLPFYTLPRWAARQHGVSSPMREPAAVSSTPDRLDLLGTNLVEVYQELKSAGGPDAWRDTMELVRLGLGEDFEDIRIRTQQGTLGLEVRLRGVSPDISMHSLSDGQLYYLALVAMFRLEKHHAGHFGARSLLVFDEPDLHLHPSALARVVGMFEESAADFPVLLATQSDALLDSITDAASAVRVCEMGERASTSVKRLDAEALRTWLGKYHGVGKLRSEGYLDVVTRA